MRTLGRPDRGDLLKPYLHPKSMTKRYSDMGKILKAGRLLLYNPILKSSLNGGDLLIKDSPIADARHVGPS